MSNPNPKTSQQVAPADHPYAYIVRDWLKKGGIEYRDVETEDGQTVKWNLTIGDPSMSMYLAIAADGPKSPLGIALDIALARMPVDRSGSVKEYLLKRNSTFRIPFRFGLTGGDIIALQWTTYCEDCTEAFMREALELIPTVATKEFEELRKEFNLAPYLDGKQGGKESKPGPAEPTGTA